MDLYLEDKLMTKIPTYDLLCWIHKVDKWMQKNDLKYFMTYTLPEYLYNKKYAMSASQQELIEKYGRVPLNGHNVKQWMIPPETKLKVKRRVLGVTKAKELAC